MHPIKRRQRVFWEWADCELHSRCQDGVVAGVQIDVQVRTSRAGKVQLFIGGYDSDGRMVFEEYYEDRAGETMTQALAWGVERAKPLAASAESGSTRVLNQTNTDAQRRGPE